MTNQSLLVETVKNHISEKGERNLFEHSRSSRRNGENPCIGHKVICTPSRYSAVLEGTLDSGAQTEAVVELSSLHPEWKRVTEGRAMQFFSEVDSLVGQRVPVRQNVPSYTLDYDSLIDYF